MSRLAFQKVLSGWSGRLDLRRARGDTRESVRRICSGRKEMKRSGQI